MSLNSVPSFPSIDALPHEVIIETSFNLSLNDLRKLPLLSHRWYRMCSDPIFWKRAVYQELAFGSDKWARCFGESAVKNEDRGKEFSSLPVMDIICEYRKFKALYPDSKRKDLPLLIRVPQALNGKLCLKTLMELVKAKFTDVQMSKSFVPAALENLPEMPILSSRWILMGDRLNYFEGDSTPMIVEAVIYKLIMSIKQINSDGAKITCQEKFGRWYVVVGDITINSIYMHLDKFPSSGLVKRF